MRVFRDLWWFFKRERQSYGWGVFLLFLVALLELFPPYVVRVVVDESIQGTLTSGRLWMWMGWLLAAGLAMYGLRFIWRVLIFGASHRLARLLRRQLYQHYTRLSPSFYYRRRTGDLMAHATNDIQAVQVTAGDGVLTFVDSLVLGGLVVFSMAVFISWKLTLIALLPMPLMAMAVGQYGKLLHKRFLAAQAAFSDINNKVQENISGVRVVKAFGREEAEKRSFRKQSDDVVHKNIAVAKVESLFEPTISLIAGLSFFLAVAFGSGYVVNQELTIGQLTQFTIYLGQLIWPMLAFGFLFNIMQRGRASYDRIRSLLRVQPDIVDREGALKTIPDGDIRYEIQTFTYPESDQPVLREIRATVGKGETLGIVGRTGSGKTTLFKLLLREFEPVDGTVRIGGKPVTEYRLSALRQTVGYVPQDHFLFSATIAENIAFGRPQASREKVEEAAKLACVHEDILQLEQGYDTVVGERGVTLSGGQKQRISIARALLLDPEILLLDDSLSAVDARTEERILEALRNHRRNRTTLICAHRLSGIEHADQILVLEDGGIAERGTHTQLLKQEGWYAWMYRRQQLESLIEQGGGGNDDSQVAPLSSTTP
ncbi:ABC transporter transmembrane domain-containing protein [Paludifilum halophilum]|uniref:Multidrug ABC transporter permease/ATP-binding protein n=1 Tax=Paludifilum halophilum TaxID=1642702 RepID=A0A235B860_9BACL|nr:ABC transporter transmembrane domain-containing protein [Paludifilum halophilum]OYD08503.1 multidrug ABC transporter permease/ATP-binding protein [Paludifilum halophilum]